MKKSSRGARRRVVSEEVAAALSEAPEHRPRTQMVSEAIVAAVPEPGRRLRTRVVSEAIVAALADETTPAEGEDAEAGAGA